MRCCLLVPVENLLELDENRFSFDAGLLRVCLRERETLVAFCTRYGRLLMAIQALSELGSH
jgi:hypothetical protein